MSHVSDAPTGTQVTSCPTCGQTVPYGAWHQPATVFEETDTRTGKVRYVRFDKGKQAVECCRDCGQPLTTE